MPAIAPSIARAALCVLLGCIACTAARAQAPAPQSLDDIGAAAIAALGAGDAQSAQAVVDPALRLPRCSRPLEAVASGPATAQVRCADDPGWRLYVPVRVHREAEVVVLRSPAAAGVPIAAGQLVVQRRDVGTADGAVFADPAALVGRVPNRALAPGAVPTEADLALGAPLRRGDPVVLVSRTGGVEVRTRGRALGPARAGGIVAVENPSSHRQLRGRLVSEGVVELFP